MKKQIQILIIVVVLFFVAGAAAAFAQKATRITFAKGARTMTVSGHLNGYKGEKLYVVRLRKGQTLSTEQAGKNYITVGILDPSGKDPTDMDLSCHSNHIVGKTKAGDYKISVS